MHKLVKGFMVAATVAAVSTGAMAQDGGEAAAGTAYPTQQASTAVTKGVVVPRRDGVRKVLISGGIDFWGVFREKTFDQVFKRTATTNGRDEAYINALFNLNVTIDVNDSLSGYFELETGPADTYGAEVHRVGDDNQFARFRQGYLDVGSTALGFDKDTWEATLRIGLFNARYDARGFPAGEGNPFMLDVINSENPFTGSPTLTKAGANGTASVGFPPFSRNTYLGGNAWFNNYAGQKKTQEAGGIALNQRLIRDEDSAINLDLDIGAITILETGLAQNDVNIGYAVADFSFGDAVEEHGVPSHASRFSLIGVFFGEGDSYVGDVGGALEWLLLDGMIEVFGEGHYQAGAYHNVRTVGASDITRQEAYGGFGGVRIQAPWHEYRPFFEVSGTWVSGDDGNPARNNAARRSTNRDLLSLENNNETLILEGSQIGFDIDTNYFAIKAKGGVTWKQLELTVVGGIFQVNTAPDPVFYAAALPVGETEFDDALGIEVDVTITWRPTDTVAIWATAGYLTGAGLLDDFYKEDTFMAGSLGASVRF